MKLSQFIRTAFQMGGLILIIVMVLGASVANASDVEVRLSSREAFVGSPLVLQIEVSDSEQRIAPELPEIDGVKIQPLGEPSQRSQVTIINGRYNEKTSVTYYFRLTPSREGTFEIPSFTVDTGDEIHRVESIRFSATRSETGDLLFVKVRGDREQVFVGQPVELSLEILLKPFDDRENRVRLSEYAMWKCVDQQATNWGPFHDRLQELADNRQRPGGEEVLRKDDDGVSRSYYRYQIDATVYPDRPGQLSLEDIQIVVNYPSELGRRRSPLNGFFSSGGLGGFDEDDLLNPFDRLAITRTRPIVADTPVANTRVLPIPEAGRPATYQGAVGQYQMTVTAGQRDVSVGEPIPLEIAIAGTGPMDLVRAPRLSDVKSMDESFQVPNTPLAGTTQGRVKYFETSIRPKKEGVTEIPAIPFSFFDPEQQQFRTVYSDPISIRVRAGETLALDDVVADQVPAEEESADTDSSLTFSLPDWSGVWKSSEPNFENVDATNLLESSSPTGTASSWLWWWLPPLIWLLALAGRTAVLLIGGVWSAGGRQGLNATMQQLGTASDAEEIAAVLLRHVLQQTDRRIAGPSNRPTTITDAVGRLRLLGHYPLAATIESFWNRQDATTREGLPAYRDQARQICQQLERELANSRPTNAAARRSAHQIAGQTSRLATRITLVTVACGLPAVGDTAWAAEASSSLKSIVTQQDMTAPRLLKEATQIYQSAQAMEDTTEQQERFALAADRYQLLLDQGFRNEHLLVSAGNAYFQSGQLGRAIVNYRRALRQVPGLSTAESNLEYARNQVKAGPASGTNPSLGPMSPIAGWARWIGLVAWVGFWAVLLIRLVTALLPWWIPVTLLVVALPGLAAQWVVDGASPHVVIVEDRLAIREGDGEIFGVSATLENTDGWETRVLEERPQWVKLALPAGRTGWVPRTAVAFPNRVAEANQGIPIGETRDR